MGAINPHDKYFKSVFSNKNEAKDLISNVIDSSLSVMINYKTLNLENTSYITKELKESFSDLVFSVKMNELEIKITLLLEHKSYLPKYPHIQLMNYMSNIWMKQEQNKESLTRILPIYIYHGKKTWSYKSFKSYFDIQIKQMDVYTPDFDYSILDLSKYSDEQIETNFKHIYVRTSLLLLKNYFDEQVLKKNLFSYLSNLKQLLNSSTYAFMRKTAEYIVSSTELDKHTIYNNFSKISEKGGEIAMTTADKLRQEGKFEVLRTIILNNYLEKGLDIKSISTFLSISENEVKKFLIEEGVIVS
jgi:predicted transposase/invertase (TIGR01784 family)